MRSVTEGRTFITLCTWLLAARGVYAHTRRAIASSSAITPAASPGFNFHSLSDMTNCTPATFSWFYGADTMPQPGDLIFIITSDVPGNTDLDQVITPAPLDPMARTYTWPSVNATPGGYQLEAKSDSTSLLVLSNVFKVKQGRCNSTSASLSAVDATKSTSASIPSASADVVATSASLSADGVTPASASVPSGPAVPNAALDFNHLAKSYIPVTVISAVILGLIFPSATPLIIGVGTLLVGHAKGS
ncbi:hypothetical protein C8R46DRAFT_1186648 [Mycena filopes]|nr:hypothetical protein C8R46DRAFT_1186648 [Mycena filopes]